jgi:hypothetical protein
VRWAAGGHSLRWDAEPDKIIIIIIIWGLVKVKVKFTLKQEMKAHK